MVVTGEAVAGVFHLSELLDDGLSPGEGETRCLGARYIRGTCLDSESSSVSLWILLLSIVGEATMWEILPRPWARDVSPASLEGSLISGIA